MPHALTAVTITEPASVHVLLPDSVPNPNWLRPGIPSAGQQSFGDELLAKYKFVLIPSAVSTHSWNLIFTAASASGAYTMKTQERFALDPRLHPASSQR